MSILGRLISRAIVFPLVAGAATLQIGKACAQADLNIQSRIDAVTQPFQVQPVPITSSGGAARPESVRQPARREIVTEPTCFEKDRRCLTPAELEKLVKPRLNTPKLLTVTPSATSFIAELQSEEVPLARKQAIIKALGLPINIKPPKRKALLIPPNIKPGKSEDQAPTQPTTVKFIFPVGPTYESNATKSDLLAHADTSIALGGGFQLTTQGFRNLDVIGVSAGTTSTRYVNLTSKNLDILSSAVQYQLFLGAYHGDGRPLDLTHGSNLPTGQVSFNTLTFGLQNSTAFAPTFRAETLNLLTPTVVYAWQNLPVGGGLCTTKLNPKADAAAFCYYADVNVTLGHTSSDNSLQENTNFGVAATLGDRISGTDLVATLGTWASGKVYDNVPGGRRDLLLQIGPKLQFSPANAVSTSIGVVYNRNYSNVAAAAWHGWIVQSAVTYAFAPQ
ncbi:hypothetical protein [Bradyrhizobium sp. Ce-3]|uniref:hypothetical protein n=1 Tax=Bradyrhizobium sp. Ce-3 TaxID=2913970 RepID=UPI001FC8E3E4|nr:hypothetical protein [Bradyrhizobium sp. Ce-3]GKQ55721.1 hypothetical protein BRSPCE3_65760 [Bradyrhizobium sp. Ce-3]